MTKRHMRNLFRIFGRGPVPAQQTTDGLHVAATTRATTRPDGIVLLNIDQGSVFTANLVGARIWEGVTRREDLRTIASTLAKQYSIPLDQAEADTVDFVSELRSKGFLIAGGVRC